ncbi:unnamed protein product [Citrullus colocynthis]|uniref:Uncharacterized protein n=1 Tax=Citrullus colocynthis TaxID=252529 RepID=A0ABP0XNR8_9ROSI
MAEGERKTINNGKKVHILVVTYPAQGHTNPLYNSPNASTTKVPAVTFVITKFLFNNSPAVNRPPPFPIEAISDGRDADGFLFTVSAFGYHGRLESVRSQTLWDLP